MRYIYLINYYKMNEKEEVCIHIFGQDNGLYDNIFQIKKKEKETIIKKDYGDIKKKKTNKIDDTFFGLKKLKKKKRIKLSFICYKYPNLNDRNIKQICLDVFQWIKDSPNKKNIIIKFESTFIKELSNIINKLVTDKPFMLFNLEENIDIQEYLCLFKYFKHPQYISYNISSEKKDPQKYYSKIISYILEKSFYYNELGNNYGKYFPYNLFYKEPRGFLYFNILLTGESRAGKSCFINRLFNKLICYESSKFESSTLQINSYELYPPEEENPNPNILKKGFGGIKVFDTPGLVKTNDLKSFELIKEKLGEIFYKIHIIYFFIKSQSNLEQCINMLKYIKEINNERRRNNKNTIPIIFIKNGEDLNKNQEKPILFQELKKELQKYKLMELYDNSININNKEKEYNLDNFFDEEEDNGQNYDNYIEGNIIQIHIPTGKNINKIFSTTKEYLLKNNDLLIKNDFSSIKNDVKILVNFYIKEKLEKKSLTYNEKQKYKELYEACNNFVVKFKNNCSLLYNLNILSAKSKGLKIVGTIGLYFFTTLFFLIIFSIPFIIIMESQTFNYIAIKYGFGENDIYDYGLEKYIYEKEKSEKINKEKLEKLQEKCLSLFEDILYYIGPIQCLIKSKELTQQIINLFDEISNRSEESWNTFKVEKI